MSKKSKYELKMLERIATSERRVQSLRDQQNAIQREIETEEATLGVLLEIKDSVNVKDEGKNEQTE